MSNDTSKVLVGLTDETIARVILLSKKLGLSKSDVLGHCVALAERIYNVQNESHFRIDINDQHYIVDVYKK